MAFSTAALVRPASLNSPRQLAAVLEAGQHEQLAGDELVLALLREFVGHIQQPLQIIGDMHFPFRSLARWAADPTGWQGQCAACSGWRRP